MIFSAPAVASPLLLGGARVTTHLAMRAMAGPTHDFSIRKSVLREAARRGFAEAVGAAARQARQVTLPPEPTTNRVSSNVI